ncbi:hypothetical protein D3C72_704580 [compost metagenome]
MPAVVAPVTVTPARVGSDEAAVEAAAALNEAAMTFSAARCKLTSRVLIWRYRSIFERVLACACSIKLTGRRSKAISWVIRARVSRPVARPDSLRSLMGALLCHDEVEAG